jgi:polyhydroxyalkanoate synthesis repressor PhaR
MQKERLIRKYSNRRLYDTTASRHVTLEDLRQVIVAGDRIKVVDDKSGEDLTRAVLLQIIAEQEQFGMPVLGSELLEMIIRFYGSPMQALLSRYLGQAFTGILRQQEAMQSEMAKALQAPFAPLTELARQNMEMWEQMKAATRNAFTGAPPSSGAGSSDGSTARTATNTAERPNAAEQPNTGERPSGTRSAPGGGAAKKRNQKGK